MDILRKELDAIYTGQHLDRETLDAGMLATALSKAKAYSEVNNGCCVITDASADRCYIMGGSFCRLLGLSDTDSLYDEADSSDEDAIYRLFGIPSPVASPRLICSYRAEAYCLPSRPRKVSLQPHTASSPLQSPTLP